VRLTHGDQYRRMPWKNGGGETVEIAVSPEGAGLEDFDWRVSMARVAADGPFSTFAGIDRTLCILESGRIVLRVGAAVPVELAADSPPHAFPADVATEARLLDGPVLDLNVMTRRGRCRHEVERLAVAGPTRTAGTDGTALVLCPAGGVMVEAAQGRVALGPFDSLRIEGAPMISCMAAVPATVFVIRLLQQS
jgi:environmental stress-induced protein Ves